VLRMFSTFIQNRYNNIRIRALGANKTPRTRAKTMFGYLMAILMEAVIRVYVTDELLKLLGIKTSKKSFIKEL
jgi:hypothetical protein